jgi:hypothetical protein
MRARHRLPRHDRIVPGRVMLGGLIASLLSRLQLLHRALLCQCTRVGTCAAAATIDPETLCATDADCSASDVCFRLSTFGNPMVPCFQSECGPAARSPPALNTESGWKLSSWRGLRCRGQESAPAALPRQSWHSWQSWHTSRRGTIPGTTRPLSNSFAVSAAGRASSLGVIDGLAVTSWSGLHRPRSAAPDTPRARRKQLLNLD